MSNTELYNRISENLIEGDADQVKWLVAEALSSGVQPMDILQRSLLNGMTAVGRLFKARKFYNPEVLLSTLAIRIGMELLEPLLSVTDSTPRGTVLIDTVPGDRQISVKTWWA